jgi:hypothetical protein
MNRDYPPEYDEPELPFVELIQELKKLSTGRNEGCWPICAFCGKDADLESTGCSGIKDVRFPTEKEIEVYIGAHKTICGVNQENVYNMPDEDVDEWMDICTEIVSGCGIGGEWTGDDWSLAWDDSFIIEWVKIDSDETMEGKIECPKETAKAIFKKACDIVESDFEPEIKLCDEMIDEVYQQAIEKYGD